MIDIECSILTQFHDNKTKRSAKFTKLEIWPKI